MFKILNSLYYWFLYGCNNKIFVTSIKLDILLIYLKEFGIKSIENSTYHIKIIFNDGTKLRFWNENRWYSWMSNGTIEFSDGKCFSWNDKMPRNEVLYEFKKVVKSIENKKDYIDNDYSEFLPQKIIRKMKLKKLK